MVDIKTKPFYLSDEEVKWVEDTYNNMTLLEKIGQLFIVLKANPGFNKSELETLANEYKIGGFRWQNQGLEGAYKQNTTLQELSKIPQLIAANCDDGGNGAVDCGSVIATAVECGASNNLENAYNVGYVSATEATAIGTNWLFNPVVDIYKNWRNTIVNTRSFSEDKNKVLANARAYIKGVKAANPNIAVTAKHFPGDGVDELDHHLSFAINNLSVEEWEDSFGYVYRNLINDGIESIMVGHIALPEMTRKLCPGILDKDIKPASIAKELVTDLLRKDMGFNGLIVTDASHMIGLCQSEKRENYIYQAINAGCDMFLFTNETSEDIDYVIKAYENNLLSEERLKDAVYRILAMKAHLKLYDKKIAIPSVELLKNVGAKEFSLMQEKAADEAITLVKDTRNYLPLNVEKNKRCFLVYIGNPPKSVDYKTDPVKQILIEELEAKGFIVDVCPSYYDLELQNGPTFFNNVRMMTKGSCEKFKNEHDFALVVINVKGYAQENNVRIKYSCAHSKEMLWYNEEIPTIAISLNYTNHLIDLSTVHTMIHSYLPTRIHIRKTIEKMVGSSKFNGKAEENVFCDRWETKL